MENRLVHANSHPETVPSFGIDDRRSRVKEKRCLGCCLPREILLIILSYLSVVDYVSFPFVCKCWRSAFQLCSPLISQKKQIRLPWYVLLKREQDSKEQQILKTTGKIGDLSTRRIYTSNIPELCGSRILSSRHGWLLLFSSSFCANKRRSSLFFLNPFSRARIDIPLNLIDDDIMTNLTCCVFDTSAPPTSPDCIIFVVCCRKEEEGEYPNGVIKIGTCRRGESTWQTSIFKGCATSPIENTIFVDGFLYCFHEHGFLTSFDVVTRSYGDVLKPRFRGPGLVTHVCRRDGNRVYLCVHGYEVNEVELKKNEPPTISRSSFWTPEFAFHSSQSTNFYKSSELKLDTFNARAWCIGTDKKDGHITFNWHNFQGWGFNCLGNHICSTFVMWVQPIWVDPSSANLSWMS